MKAIISAFLITTTMAHSQVGYYQRTTSGTLYHTYECLPTDVGIFWANSNGVPFRTFNSLHSNLVARGYQVKFMMNGGIFDEGGVPTGLLIEDGIVRREINLRDAKGNFYLKPNGVFYLDASGAHIVDSSKYISQHIRPVFAIQSGPLLLNNGIIHKDFNPASSNRLHRNGVGILPDGNVLFVESEMFQPRLPTLYDFAQFFRESGCKGALFLDGDISQHIVLPSTNTLHSNHFGSIIAVFTKDAEHAPPAGRGEAPRP